MTKKKASKKEDYTKRVRVNDGIVDLYSNRSVCYLLEQWGYEDVCKLLQNNKKQELVDWFDDTKYLEVVEDVDTYYIPLEE